MSADAKENTVFIEKTEDRRKTRLKLRRVLIFVQ